DSEPRDESPVKESEVSALAVAEAPDSLSVLRGQRHPVSETVLAPEVARGELPHPGRHSRHVERRGGRGGERDVLLRQAPRLADPLRSARLNGTVLRVQVLLNDRGRVGAERVL